MHEGLRDPHARDALLEVGVDDGDALAREVVEPGGLAPEDHRGNRQGHHDGERAQAELEVDDDEGDPHADEGDEGDQRGKQPVLDQRFELVDVGGHPGHDPARHLALVVVQRQTLHVGPDADAQGQHDPLGGTTGDEGLADLVDEVDQGDDEEDRGRREEHGLGALRHAVVDAGLDQDRAGQAGQRVDDHQEQPQEQRSAELTQKPSQVEAPVVARLFGQVDLGDVTHGAQRGHPLQQFGRRGQIEPPAAAPSAAVPTAAAQPGPEARRADRLHDGWRAAPTGGRPPVGPGRRRLPGRGGRAVALRPGGQRGERLDPVPRRHGQVLLEAREQGPVDGAAGQELLVRAVVHHAPVVQDDDAVGQMEGGLPVRHQQRGPIRHDAAQAFVNGLFDLGVDGAGGVIEDEDARVRHDGPGQCDPLTLPAREGQPALAHDGVVAARELEDELVGLGHPGRRLDLRIGGVGTAVGDVGPHRVGEEEALLEHDADLAAQRLQGDPAHVVPVDEDGARGRDRRSARPAW